MGARSWESWHGSNDVFNGNLRGTTDTDYFYFFCPKCPDNQILLVSDYIDDSNKTKRTKYGHKDIGIVFKIKCAKCSYKDYIKITNRGWQGGTFQNT